MLLRLLRACYVVLLLGMSFWAFSYFYYAEHPNLLNATLAVAIIIGLGGTVFASDLIEKEKQITTISAVAFGLLMGLLLGYLFGLALDPLLSSWFPQRAESLISIQQIARMVVTIICCYISISTLLQTKDEFRFIIPYVEFSKQVKGGRPFVLDTSVVIDGRIADICETRIIDSKLILPRFVLQELQAIADSSDKMKRNRGRRGLDILKKLQNNPKLEVEMNDGDIPGEPDQGEKIRVDERLVLFAKSINGRVVTNDFNLNKIAQIQGVDVINLNEVANALKSVALPGEALQVRIVKAGDQIGQGVGYLDDGTMVVVEQGRNAIGQEVMITVTSALQTPAGRMIFGKIERPSGNPSSLNIDIGKMTELK
ncbi:PIN/TRAM domain-containing protein [Telmatocola sphagniphila]|uniref:PIN/TRAM domain-containing protein n=1 Tax=Telmatocola sphagniphila TaxID=1123043 RepID=A0A8E6BAA3_9BACT|nr:PIN domain-containing protein [Telmatocola sphagniphila]QVL33290.1 PIN/TRAM domain-containing protein [Telmatocola sphagniphila]